MDKKKFAYAVAAIVCLVVSVIGIAWITKQEVRKQDSAGAPSSSRQQSSEQGAATVSGEDISAVQKEESSYNIGTKQEADKALDDMDGLIQSAGSF
jgi:hypothetical protein